MGRYIPALNHNRIVGKVLPHSLEYMELDRDDIPTFESEASYLRRLKLLLPAELKRIKKGDFKPVAIEMDKDRWRNI